MPDGDAGHAGRRRDGRWLRRATALVVLLVLGAAAASYRFDLGARYLGTDPPSPISQPALVLPPPGLELPAMGAAAPVARPEVAGAVDGAAVRRAVARLLGSKRLGRHVVVGVAQADGAVVFEHGTGLVTPASTMKLLTSTAALAALGPDHRFETRVVATPSSSRIVLVGGGDPLLAGKPVPASSYPARADVVTLARATARALRQAGRTTVRLGYDASLFTGPADNPRWEPSYVPDDVSPISALWVDEGRTAGGRSPDPAAEAADVFASALRKQGIRVVGAVTERRAPAEAAGGVTMAAVRGAPLAQVVQHVLEVSDNEAAEVLARQAALGSGRPGSFVGGAAAVSAILTELGVDLGRAEIYDGSGLSRHNRLPPAAILGVLGVASSPEHPELRSVVADVPVAGFSGSLTDRFTKGDPAGLGMVRAKTGTLTGVHGLAGTVTSVDGVVMRFVAIADRVRLPDNLEARVRIDRIAAALAGCTCAATP